MKIAMCVRFGCCCLCLLMLVPLTMAGCLQLVAQSAQDWAAVAKQYADDAARDGSCDAGATYVQAAQQASAKAGEAAGEASDIGQALQRMGEVAPPDFLALLTRVEQSVVSAQAAYNDALRAVEHARFADDQATEMSDKQVATLSAGAAVGMFTMGIGFVASAVEGAVFVAVSDAEAEAAAEEALQKVALAVDQMDVANRAVNELRSAMGLSPREYADEFMGFRFRLNGVKDQIGDQGPALSELEDILSTGTGVGDFDHFSLAGVIGELTGDVNNARQKDEQSVEAIQESGADLHHYEAQAQEQARKAQEAAAQAYASCHDGQPPPTTAQNPFGQGAGFNQDLFGIQGSDGYVPPPVDYVPPPGL